MVDVDGVPVEMGGQWVGPTQDVVLGLIEELGLEAFRSYDQGEDLVVFDGNVVRSTLLSDSHPSSLLGRVSRTFTPALSVLRQIRDPSGFTGEHHRRCPRKPGRRRNSSHL